MHLANVYNQTAKYPQAESYYLKALKRFESFPNMEINEGECFINLGILYVHSGQYPQAESYLKKALKCFKAILGKDREREILVVASHPLSVH